MPNMTVTIVSVFVAHTLAIVVTMVRIVAK